MSKANHTHRNLLSKHDSFLLIVGLQSGRSRNETPPASQALDALLQAATQAGVPVIWAAQRHPRLSGQKIDERSPVENANVFLCDGVNPWDYEPLVDRLRDCRRHRIVFAGETVETSMTFAVLGALEQGFDVFVVQDAAYGPQPEQIQIAMARMIQAGAVPATTLQVTSEWMREG